MISSNDTFTILNPILPLLVLAISVKVMKGVDEFLKEQLDIFVSDPEEIMLKFKSE